MNENERIKIKVDSKENERKTNADKLERTKSETAKQILKFGIKVLVITGASFLGSKIVGSSLKTINIA